MTHTSPSVMQISVWPVIRLQPGRGRGRRVFAATTVVTSTNPSSSSSSASTFVDVVISSTPFNHRFHRFEISISIFAM